MKKRNVIIASILAVAIVGGSIGGYYGFRSMNRPVTMVYAVSDLSSSYWGDDMTLEGMITSDASQNVYLSTEQKVKEVLVQEGDTVQEGDVLMSYDTTAKQLELETMELSQKQDSLKLDEAKKQLEELKKKKPVSDTPLSPNLDDPGIDEPFFPDFPGLDDPGVDDPGIEDPGQDNPVDDPNGPTTEEPTPTPPPSYDDAQVYDGEEKPLEADAVPYKGTGQAEDPLVFLCQPGTVITGEFLNRMAGLDESAAKEGEGQERNAFFFRLEIRKGNQASGQLLTVWEQDGSQITEPYAAGYRTVFQMAGREDRKPDILFEQPLSSVNTAAGTSVKLDLKVQEEDGVSYQYRWFFQAGDGEENQEDGQPDTRPDDGQQETENDPESKSSGSGSVQENTDNPQQKDPNIPGDGQNGGDTSGTEDTEQEEKPWVELTEYEGMTEITLDQVTKKDQGNYMVQITAVNAYGTSKAVATACVTVTESGSTPTPTPTQAPEISVTPTPDATPTPEVSVTPDATPTPDVTPDPTQTPDVTPTEVPDATPAPTDLPDTTPAPGPADTPADTQTPADTSAPVPADTSANTSAPADTSGAAPASEGVPNGNPASVPTDDSNGTADTENGTAAGKTAAAGNRRLKASTVLAAGTGAGYRGNSGNLILVSGTDDDAVGLNTDLGSGDVQETYTKEELKKAIADKEKEIRDLQLNVREAELKIQHARKELEDQTVKATIAGVVRKVGDPEKPSQDGSAFIQVDSQQGLYVRGYVSELMLDQLVPGTSLQISSWSSGAFAMATVKEISPYPTEEYASYGSGAQASYYPFTALIEDGADGFTNMEYVGISMTVGMDETSQNAIYLSKTFIREENGQKYVYVRAEDGTLERRPVKTGKILWGSQYEIKSGLTSEDYIAFPYAKNELEGTQTEESTLSELYNY